MSDKLQGNLNNNNASVVKILSFDPGFTMLGWALGEYDTESGKLTILKYGDLKVIKQIKKQKEFINVYDHNVLASFYLEEEFNKLISLLKPHFIVSEDVFMNFVRPQAYTPLMICIHILSRILFQYFKQPLYKISPKSIKMIVTGHGTSDKEGIRDSILTHPNIVIKENKQIPIDRLLSHHTDAIAVNYAFVRTILPTLTTEQLEQGTDQYTIKN
jgi:Holliday junction resolvasome RuvABC endonuclease subunit